MNLFTSLYTASAGAIAQQQGLDVTANNAANVSTQGFRPDRASFSDLVHTGVRAGEDAPKTGSGEKLAGTETLYAPAGGLRQTGRKLDYALTDGRQFFAVRTADGIRYTRSGSFAASAATNGRFYLTDAQGGLVLDRQGRTIEVTDEHPARAPGAFTFRNLDGLRKTGDNYFAPTALSGAAAAAPDAGLRQGYLEDSGVDLADVMADLIQQERAFQLNTRMVQMSDEVAQTVDNLR